MDVRKQLHEIKSLFAEFVDVYHDISGNESKSVTDNSFGRNSSINANIDHTLDTGATIVNGFQLYNGSNSSSSMNFMNDVETCQSDTGFSANSISCLKVLPDMDSSTESTEVNSGSMACPNVLNSESSLSINSDSNENKSSNKSTGVIESPQSDTGSSANGITFPRGSYESIEHLRRHIRPETRSCDDTDMVVQASNGKAKRYFCIFCKKTCTTFARHLESCHKAENEAEVKRLRKFEKGSKERREIVDRLRKKGTFQWNMDSELNHGELMTSRRPKNTTEAKKYTTCVDCKGSYSTTSVHQHFKRCVGINLNGERSVRALGREVEGRVHQNCSVALKNCLARLNGDAVASVIPFDWLPISYGNRLCKKYGSLRLDDMIRSNLRLPARILIELRKICPSVTDFASIYCPPHYDSVIEAIRTVGKIDEDTQRFGAPSTALAGLAAVKEIGKVLTCEYIKQENPTMLTRTENFLKLVNTDASAVVCRPAFETQAQMHLEKVEQIPTTDDMKTFAEYLEREAEKYFTILESKFSYQAWLSLSELTLVSVMTFNRKRVGETQKILRISFDQRRSLDEETISTLSDEDKVVADTYSRMEIRGKRGRPVPVLLNPLHVKFIQILLSYRAQANVPLDNKFLFGLPATTKTKLRVISACPLIRKFSVACEPKDPKSIRGTMMRKQLARVCITKDLDDNTVAEVADFMGHEERIHRLHYRRNPIERQIVKMSKLLENAQGNQNINAKTVGRVSKPKNVRKQKANGNESKPAKKGKR